MTTYKKPIPTPDIVTEEYYKGAKRHELLIQHCKHCGKNVFYPRALCPFCLTDNLEWVKACGNGRVYSFTVVAQAAHPGFRGEEPYIVAIIELDEGTHMMSNVVDCPVEDCKINMPVTVVFDDITPEITLPKFKPIK